MKRIAQLSIVLLLLCACNAVSSLLHDGEVVASVGKNKLYLAELANYIPSGITAEDSSRIAQSYIEAWTRDMRFIELAEAQLSKEEKDVSRELEEYKRVLLRFRYEQKYINQRLDTAISMPQVEEYYNSHKELFRIGEPVVKARFAVIAEKSSHLTALKKMMSEEDSPEDIIISDSLAYVYAVKYTDFGGRWTDLAQLASELNMEQKQLQGSLRKGFFQARDGEGNLLLAYIADFVRAGEVAPVEYCSDRIRDIILSNRKQALSAALEQELMKDNK